MKLFRKLSLLFCAVVLLAGVTSFDASAAELTNIRVGIAYTAQYSNYSKAIKQAGGVAVRLPLVDNKAEAREQMKGIDALLIPGGSAIDPRLYGAIESSKLGEIDPKRDASDILMLKVAKDWDMPVIGICRGMQVMNVVQGGSMYQNIRSEYEGYTKGLEHNSLEDDEEYSSHDVTVYEDTLLHDVVGRTTLKVASSHRQAVKKVGNNLEVTARSADGIVEGIQFTNQTFMIGVQFHPEKSVVMENGEQIEFFQALKSQGGKYRERVIETLPAPEVVASVLTGHDDVKVYWDHVEGATGYNVYYKRSTAKEYSLLEYTTAVSLSKENMNDGIEYIFKVVPCIERGGNLYEVSSYRTTSIYTLKKMDPPVVQDYSTKKARLTWSDMDGQTGYQISQSTSPTATNIVETYKTKTGEAKQVENTPGVRYYYKIRAYKLIGGKRICGPWSDVVEYKRELAAPEIVTTRLSGYDDVKVSWSSVEGATGYSVYYKRASAKSYSLIKRTTSRSLVKADLNDNMHYMFKVVPYRTEGGVRYSSANYKISEIHTLKKIAKPKVTTQLLVNVKVDWKGIEGATGYEISKSTSKTKKEVVAKLENVEETFTLLERSDKKGKYYYRVRAYKVENDTIIYGPWSDAYSYSR